MVLQLNGKWRQEVRHEHGSHTALERARHALAGGRNQLILKATAAISIYLYASQA